MEKIAVITGATSGIGLEFAKSYSKDGYSVILTGRNEKRLKEMKRLFEKKAKGQIWILALDLAEPGAAEKLYEFVYSRVEKVEVLINNAGFGYVGEFLKCDKNVMEQMLIVNMQVVTELCYLFGKRMCEFGSGVIVNVASTGSYHPGPYTSVYYATKAYVLSLSEALELEFKASGVRVIALCPGATDTQFSKRAGRCDNAVAMSPGFVVKEARKGIKKGEKIIIPGLFYKLFVKMPRKIAKPLIGRQQKIMSANIDK